MMRYQLLALPLVLLLPAGLMMGQQVAMPPLAIQGATLWDGTGSAPLADAIVLVDGNRIRCAGSREACPVPADARRLDARGRFLLPGLIDTHVHMLFRLAGVTDDRITRDLRDLLARGVTTVRDMGNNPARLLETVDSARPAPRVFAMQLVAGPQFFLPEVEHASDGNLRNHVPAALGMRQLGWSPILFTPSGNPQSIIRQAKDAGAIGLKLYQDLDSAQVANLTAAAHAAGMPVWGHAWLQPASVLQQSQAGQDGVVHAGGLIGELLDSRSRDSLVSSSDLLEVTADSATALSAHRPEVQVALDTLVARGTFLEPTLRAAELSAQRARRSHSRGQREALPNRYALAVEPFGMEVTRLAVARGVRITAGSDHVAVEAAGERAQLTDELRLLVDSVGLTPATALLAATRDAAIAIGPPARDLGTVTAGKLADLLLLSADPLADIGNVDKVEWVMLGGVVHQPNELRGAR